MIRGRKRKPGTRHPCGKRIHAETERETMQTAINARQATTASPPDGRVTSVSAHRSDGSPTRG